MEGKNEVICERISVIVPIYNTEKYLARCIESILCQTYTNLEIILVDDGSTDKSGDICDFYARKDNRVKVVHKENGGAAAARNFALNMVTGQYIGFVDSDDTVEKDFFELLYDLICQYDADISMVAYREIEMGEKLEEVLRQKNEQISFLQKEIAQHNYSQIEKQTLKEELYTLKTERQALLKESYEHSEVCVKMKRIIQSYKKTDKSNERFDEEDWKQLIAETDIRWNDITIRLAAKYPLSQDEIYLCCLHLTDIPTSHFRYLMECSRDAIYKKGKRILEQKMKCTDKSISLRDFLEQFL